MKQLIENVQKRFTLEKKSIAQRMNQESQMIQMLKMIDPAKADEMEKQSKQPQINVIKVSGPGCFTQTIFEHMVSEGSKEEDSILMLPKHFFYPASNQVR